MTYTLKQPEIDLSRHRRAGHVRTPKGIARYHLKLGEPIGKHLTGSVDLEAASQKIKDLPMHEHVKALDGLLDRVSNPANSETVDENAWHAVSEHLDVMASVTRAKIKEIEEERKAQLKAAAGTAVTTGALYAIKHGAPAKAVELGKEFLTEGLAAQMVAYGANFAAAASAVIGAQHSERFVELFHRLTENPSLELGLTSAATLLIAALVSTIRKHLYQRKDKKIAKARGLAFQQTPAGGGNWKSIEGTSV